MNRPVATTASPRRPLPPAPGEAATRSATTEAAYLKRAAGFVRQTAKHLSLPSPSPQVVAAHALEKRAEWKKATWRQYKAALIFTFEQVGSAEAAEAAEQLRDGTQTPCLLKSRRTSARRSKAVSEDDLWAVLHQLERSTSSYARLLTNWLVYGSLFGLRPHEWTRCELIHAHPAAVGDTDALEGADGDSIGPLPYLRVHNGKATNGRAHGEERHLNLASLPPDTLSGAEAFIEVMRRAGERGVFQRYYSNCAKLLYRVNRQLHRNDSSKWLQLYSPRHRFASEAKKVLDTGGTAALMGHATDRTAVRHYGKRSVAEGTLGPLPVAAEKAKVRATYTPRRVGTPASHTPAAIPNGSPPRAGGKS